MMSVVVANFNRAVWMLFNIMPRSGLLKGKGSPGRGLFFGGSMKLLWVYLVMFILLAVSIVSHAAECRQTWCWINPDTKLAECRMWVNVEPELNKFGIKEIDCGLKSNLSDLEFFEQAKQRIVPKLYAIAKSQERVK